MLLDLLASCADELFGLHVLCWLLACQSACNILQRIEQQAQHCPLSFPALNVMCIVYTVLFKSKYSLHHDKAVSSKGQ